MSTGKVIFGLTALALLLGVASKKKSTTTTDRRNTVKGWILSKLTPGENADMTIFDRMSEQELQLIIDVLIVQKYPKPIPYDVMAKFDALSKKYNIFT